MSCCKPGSSAGVDRYTTFAGIDCGGNTRRVMALIEHHTLLQVDRPDAAFWAYFHQRRNARTGVQCDDLLLLASFVNQVRELFESCSDADGITLLEQLEEECF